MNVLDIRTVLFSYVLTNAICLMVVFSLWHQNRQRSPGLGFWLADFAAQFIAVLLIAFRNTLPDWLSILFGTPLVLFGTLSLYLGLERYVGKLSPQRNNLLLVSGLVILHAYFTFIQPSLQARNIILSLGLFAFCAQCAWLLLRRVDASVFRDTWRVGAIFGLYSLISVARLFADMAVPQSNDLFRSGLYDTLAIFFYQMLFIALTFALFLMVNRRLFAALENDIAERKRVEEKVVTVARFLEENPNPVMRLNHDGIILYANNGAQLLLQEWNCTVGSPAPVLWREATAQTLATKSSKTLDVQVGEKTFSIFVAPVDAANYVNLYGRDMTDRNRAEIALRESEERYRGLFDHMIEGYAYCKMIFENGQAQDWIYLAVNEAFERLTGLKNVPGKRVTEIILGIRETDQELFRRYAHVALTGQPDKFDIYVQALQTWFSVSVYSPEKEHFVAVFDVITDRKHAEAELRASEERFRTVAYFTYDWEYWVGTDGNYLYVSPSCERITGYAPEEFMHDSRLLERIVHPEDRGIILNHAQERLEKDDTQEIDFRIIRRDGAIRWINHICRSVHSTEGHWLGRRASNRDITERKHEEAEREHLLNVLESSLNEIYIFEPDTLKFQYVNSGAIRNLGYTLEQLKTLTPLDLKPEFTEISFRELVGSLRRHEKEILNFQTAHRRADGSLYPVDVHLQLVDNAGRRVFLAIILDLTERKRTETQLAKATERLNLATRAARLGIWDWNIQTNELTWDNQMYELYGVSQNTFTGAYEAWLTGIHPDDRAASDAMSLRARLGEVEYNTEFRVVWSDGSVHWLTAMGTVFRDAQGNAIRMIGVNYDITARKHTEDALRESEATFRVLFKNHPHPMWVYDLKTLAFLEVNDAALDNYGFSREEFLGMTIADIRPPEDVDRLLQNVAQERPALQHSGEWRHRLKDGRIIEVEITSHTLEFGGRDAVLVVAHNITERKRAEEALRVSEARYHSLIETQTELIARSDMSGRLTFVNEAYCQMFGKSQDELIGNSFTPTVLPEDLPISLNTIETIQSPPYRLTTMTRHLTPRGIQWIEWENSAVLDNQKKIIELQGTGREITARIKSEQEIKTLNNRLQVLISAVQELASARDLETVMAAVRTYARKLTGADGSTFVLREGDQCYYADEDAISPLWKGQRFPMTACISGWVMLNKQPAVIEDIYTDSRIPIDAYRPTFVKSLAMVPIRTHEPLGAIGNYWAHSHQPTKAELQLVQTLADAAARAVENVRLLQELEQRVEQRTAELSAANKELEAFSYSVSHDLRAPLRAIDGFSRILMEEHAPQLTPDAQRYLQIVRNNTQNMGQLVDDLLTFSRLSRHPLNRQPVECDKMVHLILQDLQLEYHNRQVDFKIGELPECQADPALLKQVWINLLSNALKFTRQREMARIEIGSVGQIGNLTYYVRDNGVGFDMQYLHKLFGVFQRLHRAEDYEGTGVGLAIVQRIVTRHGGRIWAESEEGNGATFYFTLEGGNA
ncbi:MAG: PAS domain S-box protein [Chloroflexi bacterium]|nr:PAS domain S-box protein [Chloroflexota bacterium]